MKSKKNPTGVSRHKRYRAALKKRRVLVLWAGRKGSRNIPVDWTVEELKQAAVASAPFPSPAEKKTERPSLSAPCLTEQEVIDLINRMRNEIKASGQSQVEISEFDPSSKTQNIHSWLAEVEDCALVNNWNDQQKTQFALKKLVGRASEWYKSIPYAVCGWGNWQKKLQKAFPNEQDYGQLLEDMMARTTRNGESYIKYYSDKLELVRKCGFTETKAVGCILHGILDNSLKNNAKALNYQEPEELLDFLTLQDPARNTRQISTPNSVVRIKVDPMFCSKYCPGVKSNKNFVKSKFSQ